jgi:DNA invertase Pin-like site-specific DNA recombinase
MALRIVIYARAGQKNPNSKSVQIQPQIEALYEAAQKFHMEVIGEFKEIVEGGSQNLPELDAAVAFASQNKANLLVLRIDRLGTDIETIRKRVNEIASYGVHVWVESGQILDALTIERLGQVQPRAKRTVFRKPQSPTI